MSAANISFDTGGVPKVFQSQCFAKQRRSRLQPSARCAYQPGALPSRNVAAHRCPARGRLLTPGTRFGPVYPCRPLPNRDGSLPPVSTLTGIAEGLAQGSGPFSCRPP